jgi:hypothetical protein
VKADKCRGIRFIFHNPESISQNNNMDEEKAFFVQQSRVDLAA